MDLGTDYFYGDPLLAEDEQLLLLEQNLGAKTCARFCLAAFGSFLFCRLVIPGIYIHRASIEHCRSVQGRARLKGGEMVFLFLCVLIVSSCEQ